MYKSLIVRYENELKKIYIQNVFKLINDSFRGVTDFQKDLFFKEHS